MAALAKAVRGNGDPAARPVRTDLALLRTQTELQRQDCLYFLLSPVGRDRAACPERTPNASSNPQKPRPPPQATIRQLSGKRSRETSDRWSRMEFHEISPGGGPPPGAFVKYRGCPGTGTLVLTS